MSIIDGLELDEIMAERDRLKLRVAALEDEVRTHIEARDIMLQKYRALKRVSEDAVVKIAVGQEIACDRVKLTETAVLARIDGVWIELRPGADMVVVSERGAEHKKPWLFEHRMIDDVEHVWYGDGWIADRYILTSVRIPRGD